MGLHLRAQVASYTRERRPPRPPAPWSSACMRRAARAPCARSPSKTPAPHSDPHLGLRALLPALAAGSPPRLTAALRLLAAAALARAAAWVKRAHVRAHPAAALLMPALHACSGSAGAQVGCADRVLVAAQSHMARERRR